MSQPPAQLPAQPWCERPGVLRALQCISWGVWLCTLIAICIAVARNPTDRTVTTVYREAAGEFWAQLPMYKPGQHGWLYPPQSAVIYSPFALIPSMAVGEVLWRIVITSAFAISLWRFAKLCASISRFPHTQSFIFAVLTAGSIALAAGCMRNGQMNLPLAALFILTACDATAKRWWRVTLWLCLALASKPIALPMVMLVGAVFPALWWRLPIGLLVVALLPFINPHTSYVLDQYQAAIAKMREAGEPGAGIFSDLSGMLQMFPLLGPGKSHPVPITPLAWTAIRAAAALISLAVSLLALRRCAKLGPWCLLFFGVTYLMLFNPRTEGNSYIMLAPFLAALCAWAILARKLWPALAWVLALIVLAAAHEFYKDKLDSVYLRPLCAAIAWMFVGHYAVRGRTDVLTSTAVPLTS